MGPMSRKMKDKEIEAFEAKYGYKPVAVPVAIDALAGVVDTLPGRLGEAEATMRDALHQIRLAYVAVEKAMREAVADDGDETENETGDEAGD